MEKKQTYIILGVAALVAVLLSVAIILSNTKKDSGSASGLPGLQTSQENWQPEYSGLATRLATLQVPSPGQEKYHIHARVMVYVNGSQVPVPNNIGLYPAGQVSSAVHTHAADGTVHIESDQQFEVKLGEFFDIWGVKFTDTQIGGYTNQGNKTLQVYVNGNKVDKPADYVLKPHDGVVVGYGTPGSFPTTWTSAFPAGL